MGVRMGRGSVGMRISLVAVVVCGWLGKFV